MEMNEQREQSQARLNSAESRMNCDKVEIKAVKFRRDGFYTQPFVFGGERLRVGDGTSGMEEQDKFDKNVRYRGSLQNYLIDTGSEVILVDTGLPAGFPEEVPNEDSPIYTGKDISSYMDAFKNLGYKPEQVTKILVTHKHADHTGELKSFPNAKIYVNQEETDAAELQGLTNIVPVSYTDGAYYNFPESQKIQDGIYYIKAVGISCHSSHVLRFWHRLFVETSNAEAHADMYINDYDCFGANNGCQQINVGYYISMDVIVALMFDKRLGNCQIPEGQAQSVKNSRLRACPLQERLSYI